MNQLLESIRKKAHLSVSLSRRERIIVFIAGFAVVWLLFDYMIFSPISREAEELQKELDKVEQKIQENYAAIINPESLHREIAKLEQKISFFEHHLPEAGKTGEVLTRFAELCNSGNIDVNSLNPRVVQLPEREYNQILVHMNMLADFKQIIVFMASLRSLEFFTIVEDFQIRREPGPRKRTASMVLKTFAVSSRSSKKQAKQRDVKAHEIS